MDNDELPPQPGTPEYFRQEILAFRELMGQKSFWENVERAGRAMYGLTMVYVQTNPLSESDQNLYLATSSEYDRRLAYAMTSAIMGIFQGRRAA